MESRFLVPCDRPNVFSPIPYARIPGRPLVETATRRAIQATGHIIFHPMEAFSRTLRAAFSLISHQTMSKHGGQNLDNEMALHRKRQLHRSASLARESKGGSRVTGDPLVLLPSAVGRGPKLLAETGAERGRWCHPPDLHPPSGCAAGRGRGGVVSLSPRS